MDKRQAKRYNREHRARKKNPLPGPATGSVSGGTIIVTPPTPRPVPFEKWDPNSAKVSWGDLTVVVLPRLQENNVPCDSNTGIVVDAPLHPALLGAVVVNNGRKHDCDESMLNSIYAGDPFKYWMQPGTGLHAFCVPRHRDFPLEFDEQAVEAMTSRGLSKADAQAQVDRILGWGPFCVICYVCQLEIGDTDPLSAAAQARAFGWFMVDFVERPDGGPLRQPICPTCAQKSGAELKPFPTPDEVRGMEGM